MFRRNAIAILIRRGENGFGTSRGIILIELICDKRGKNYKSDLLKRNNLHWTCLIIKKRIRTEKKSIHLTHPIAAKETGTKGNNFYWTRPIATKDIGWKDAYALNELKKWSAKMKQFTLTGLNIIKRHKFQRSKIQLTHPLAIKTTYSKWNNLFCMCLYVCLRWRTIRKATYSGTTAFERGGICDDCYFSKGAITIVSDPLDWNWSHSLIAWYVLRMFKWQRFFRVFERIGTF